jgi:putative ABC transport system permease protein
MRRVTLRSLWEHKRRLVSTLVAIVLGVSFMTGTFILSTTLDRAYDDLFQSALADVDAVVRGPFLFEDPFFVKHFDQLPASSVDEVRAIPGVAEAQPRVTGPGQDSVNRVLGSDGRPLGGASGPPTTFENWIESDALSPYHLQDGRGPESGDEIALNVAAVEEGRFDLGDTVTAVGPFGPKEYTLVGSFTFGTAKSAAGAVAADFTLAESQRLAGVDVTDQIEQVYVDAEPGVTQEDLVEALQPALPGTDVVTGAQAVQELSSNRTSGFGFLQVALNVFGAVALFVGIFVISNTFSILVAQRTRELALLRALGASREQVLGSMLLEAAVVGAVAAVVGLGGGVVLARAITGLLGSFGAELPTKHLVLQPFTFLISIGVGVSITMIAAIVPAIRATRVPPLAALRDVAVDRSNASRFRVVAGALALAAGAWGVSDAWRAGGHSRSIPAVGVGSLLLLVGSLVIGPVLAAPTVRTFGSPLPRFRGVTGKLATENAARSPKRTSATASAVVIGVALVTFVTVFAKSADRSVDEEVGRIFAGDLLVKADIASFGFPTGMPRTVAETMAKVPGIDVVTAGGGSSGQFTYPDGKTASHLLTSVDPTGFGKVVNPKIVQGDLADFDDHGILVDKFVAKDHHIKIGDRISIRTQTGRLDQVVQGIIDDRNVLGFFSVTRNAFAKAIPDALDTQVGATVDPGADVATVKADVEEALADIPNLLVLDRDGVIGDFKTQITGLITVMYGLLMLSIVIALIGVANTLSLSINERVRELGLLRAIGMDRIDLRAAIRWEACLICLLGTAVGVGVGLVIGVALTTALQSIGLSNFAVPIVGVCVIVAAAAVLGTLASVRPARRAAALPIMDALAAD